jgi:hypothetical protein
LLAALQFFIQAVFYIIVFGILFSGLLTWIIGRETTMGASGLIYVLVSFIFFWFADKILPIGRAVANCYYFVWRDVMVYFSKVDDSISWEGI